ncbi:MAG: DUF433 domain-containing protein, partial [Anaerolineae bacterium]
HLIEQFLEETMEWKEYIEINPHIKAGKPVIKGTRVPVEVVVGALGGGASLEEVSEAYALTLEQIQACLAFAADILAEESFVAVPG